MKKKKVKVWKDVDEVVKASSLKDKEKDILFFGPIGVLPDYQGLEYGATLIYESLKLAKEKGYPFVVITGNPEYYHRFGFLSAKHYDIHYNEYSEEEYTNKIGEFYTSLTTDKRLICFIK